MFEKAYVSPRSDNDIRIITEKALAPLITTNRIRYEQIDVVHIYEFFLSEIAPGFKFRVRPDAEMNNSHAYTTFDPNIIHISQSTFRSAAAGDGRARFSLAHELGHALMHVQYGKNFTAHRAFSSSSYRERVKNTEIFRDPEWQANTFAAYFLMPNYMCRKFSTPEELSNEAGVSFSAAERRIRKSRRRTA